MSRKCCEPQVIEEPAKVIEKVEPLKTTPIKKLTPISFACSSAEAKTDPAWMQFRDSLMNLMSDDKVLQIEGLYYNDESYEGSENNLGMARARNVLKLFDQLGDDRVCLAANTKGDSCLRTELNNLITFRYLRNTAKVQETANSTTIRFPFGSAQRLKDPEIENYLDEVAKRVVASGERVRLTGHTDNEDSDAFNMQLGERRAQSIADILIRKGVNPAKITVLSKGERQPVATNDTAEGRRLNRRTELEIIK